MCEVAFGGRDGRRLFIAAPTRLPAIGDVRPPASGRSGRTCLVARAQRIASEGRECIAEKQDAVRDLRRVDPFTGPTPASDACGYDHFVGARPGFRPEQFNGNQEGQDEASSERPNLSCPRNGKRT